MDLKNFKDLVKQEFGDDLRHATPSNVHDFVTRIDTELSSYKPGEPIDITQPQFNSYEEVIKDFFARVLELPCEQAVIKLFTISLQMAFAGFESEYSEKFSALFKDIEEP